ncbi:hypothetical protein [Cryptosporangium phraense]|uniref:Uncharacterized protein n=1 Tax=Cryptosporangium phraense TaxID=2593070 RepID=A0A545AG69_9ACTN|nr:hypothetical protein [Cryptosporangium phraense]TQS40329.1 hypothetical protein FL583_35525 [Cryptosporangium phraense]
MTNVIADDGVPVDFEPDAQHVLLTTLSAVLAGRSARPAYRIASRLLEREQQGSFDLAPGDSVLIGEAVAIGLVLEFRHSEKPPDPVAAVRWVRDQLGAEHGRRAQRVAGLLDHPDAPSWTEVQPPAEGEEPLLPALVLLLAGVAATNST